MALKQVHKNDTTSLTAGRVVWVVLALGYLVIWLASLRAYYTRVSMLTIEPFRLGERVIFDNSIALRDAMQRGVSLGTSAALDIGADLLQVFVYYVVAALILWRAPNRFGWFTAFVLMLMGVVSMTRAVGIAPLFPAALFLVEIPGYLVWPLWLLWLYLFPNGRPVPQKSWLPVLIMSALFVLLQALSLLAVFGVIPPRIDTLAATFSPIAVLPVSGFVLFAQIYRYRKDSNFIEQQQTKWFLFGVGIFFLTMGIFVLVPESLRSSIVTQNLLSVLFLLFPLSVALAVLRYRLFDIDVIIRRTLTYALVTALLVIIFFGSVILLQQLFSGITGAGQNEIVTVLSTLAIAALFVPVRNRVQSEIDKRFNRKKYNAQQVLNDFATTVRDETDLERLTGRLMQVVDETMQPKTVSVWLKKETLRQRKVQ